jgi:hypothetical protein
MWRAKPAAANNSAPSETRRPIINKRIGSDHPRIPEGFTDPDLRKYAVGVEIVQKKGVPVEIGF